jgi:hypothetical protein
MSQHPECKENEVFIGNTDTRKSFDCCGVGYRLGEQAYDINGKLLIGPDSPIKPVIMSKENHIIWNKIMMNELIRGDALRRSSE